MHRARPLTIILMLLAAASVLTGCGGANGPSGSGITASGRCASEEVEQENTFFDRMFGNYSPPSAVSNDLSIDDSISGGYGAVPGASMLDDSDLTDLGYSDDPWDSVTTRGLDLGDSSLSSLSLDEDPWDSLDRPSWDAAMTTAGDMYGGVGGSMDDLALGDIGMGDAMLDPSLDAPMLDDPSLDMGLDDVGAGFDDVSLDSGMMDDMSFDDPSLDDPMLDIGW